MPSAFTGPFQQVVSRLTVASDAGPGDRVLEDSATVVWTADEDGVASATVPSTAFAAPLPSGYAIRKIGTATLAGGSVTVPDTGVTADSIILLTPQTNGAGNGSVRVASRVVLTEFVISSTNVLDDAPVGYMVLEP